MPGNATFYVGKTEVLCNKLRESLFNLTDLTLIQPGFRAFDRGDVQLVFGHVEVNIANVKQNGPPVKPDGGDVKQNIADVKQNRPSVKLNIDDVEMNRGPVQTVCGVKME